MSDPLADKMFIHGVVLCSCGGQIISNTGKSMPKMETQELACWSCGKLYDMHKAYEKREEGKTVTLND